MRSLNWIGVIVVIIIFRALYISISEPIKKYQLFKYKDELVIDSLVIDSVDINFKPATQFSEGEYSAYYILENNEKVEKFNNYKKGDIIKRITLYDDAKKIVARGHLGINEQVTHPDNINKIPFILLFVIFLFPALIVFMKSAFRIHINDIDNDKSQNNVYLDKILYYLEEFYVLFFVFAVSLVVFYWAYSDLFRIEKNDLALLIFSKIIIGCALPVILLNALGSLRNKEKSLLKMAKIGFKIMAFGGLLISLIELIIKQDPKSLTVSKLLSFIFKNGPDLF